MGQLPAFEELIELADKDPEAFECFRQQACQAFIETTPSTHQHRLRAVQNRVEMALDRAKTPMARLLRLSTMMQESFFQLSAKLEEVDLLAQGKIAQLPPPIETMAEVVNLDDWKAQSTAIDKPLH